MVSARLVLKLVWHCAGTLVTGAEEARPLDTHGTVCHSNIAHSYLNIAQHAMQAYTHAKALCTHKTGTASTKTLEQRSQG